jgi:nucleotide-binding universal stress UspA family protein
MALGAASEPDLQGRVEAEEERRGTSISVEAHGTLPRDHEDALREIEACLEATGATLVVSDPFPDHEPPSAEAERWEAVLGERLACSLFVADACRAPDQVERILVPTDLSAASVHTLRHAVEVATCYEASIVLLHVLEANPYVALTRVDRLSLGATTLSEHRARRRLHQIVKKAGAGDKSPRPRITFGTPADQIARFVDENGVDLVLLSPRDANTRSTPALGSVTRRLLRRLPGPLFLLRAAEASLLPEEGNDERRHRRSKGNGPSVSPSP